jgi:hypothetical protein
MVSKRKPLTAGQALAKLVKNDPEMLRSWNETKNKRSYRAKGDAYRVRKLLEKQAKRWRDETGEEPPDLTSLDELEGLAETIGVPLDQWENYTGGELYTLGLERFRRLTPNEARDKFCFEQWQYSDATLKEINAALKRHPEWQEFSDDKAVRGAINRWADRLGVKPQKRQRGRRAKSARHETTD